MIYDSPYVWETGTADFSLDSAFGEWFVKAICFLCVLCQSIILTHKRPHLKQIRCGDFGPRFNTRSYTLSIGGIDLYTPNIYIDPAVDPLVFVFFRILDPCTDEDIHSRPDEILGRYPMLPWVALGSLYVWERLGETME
jgi:hypothetical protein